MSLYYDAASILTGDADQDSLKSRVYSGSSNIKSKPAQVYALIVECSKFNVFLKEVIDNAGLLELEPKVCSPVSMLLVSAD
jgi:putative methyltransferase